MADEKPWRFVWVEGMRGPTPEKWSPAYSNSDMQGQDRRHVIQTVNLIHPEQEHTLDYLATMYPLEIKS